jgi:hypothetical protein
MASRRPQWLLPLVTLPGILAFTGCNSNSDNTQPASITAFTAGKGSITAGDSTTLTATFLNGTGVVTPGDITVTSGQAVSVTPNTTTEYTLTVKGSDGKTVTSSTTVTIVAKPATPQVTAPMMALPGQPNALSAVDQAGMTLNWQTTNGTFVDSGKATTTGTAVQLVPASEGTATVTCTATNSLGSVSSAATSTIQVRNGFQAYAPDGLTTFFTGVDHLEHMDYVSSVGTTSPWSFPFYFVDKGHPDTNPSIAGAAFYGNGRLILCGTDQFFMDASGPDVYGPGPTLQVFTNMVTWLTQGSAIKYSDATAAKPMPMLVVDPAANDPRGVPTWVPDASVHIQPVTVTAFDATNLDPARYPLVYADFWYVDEVQAAALVDYVRRGGAVLAGVKGWVMTTYPWEDMAKQLGHAPRIFDYPLHQAMASMGLVLADEWFEGESSTTLPTADGSLARHTGKIMEALKGIEDGTMTTAQVPGVANLSRADALTSLTTNLGHITPSIPPADPWAKAVEDDVTSRIQKGTVNLTWPLQKSDPPYTMQGLNLLWNAASLDPSGTKSFAADHFPGAVDASAPAVDQTFSVDFNIRDLSALRLRPAPHTWNTTGLYAPAGATITLTVTPAGTTPLPGLNVQVGSHTDLLWNQPAFERVPRIVLSQTLKAGVNKIVSPYGGLIYLIPTDAAAATTASVEIQGAVQAPYFERGKTTNADWATVKNSKAPWAELRGNRVILTVPAADAKTVVDAEALMTKWDEIVGLYDAFVGFTGDKPEHTAPNRPWHYVADIDIGDGYILGGNAYMHNGSPIMYYQSDAQYILDIERIQGHPISLTDPEWGFWHELGHNHQLGAFTFSNFGEVTENLFSETVQSAYNTTTRVADADKWAGAQAYLAKPTRDILNDADDKTLGIEMVWTRLVFVWQLRLGCGESFYPTLYRLYREMDNSTYLDWDASDHDKAQLFAITACKAAQKDLRTFFAAWGLALDSTTLSTIQALGYPEPSTNLWTIKPN